VATILIMKINTSGHISKILCCTHTQFSGNNSPSTKQKNTFTKTLVIRQNSSISE